MVNNFICNSIRTMIIDQYICIRCKEKDVKNMFAWQISLQKQFFVVEMQFFCKGISQKVGLIINWYSFVYERNYFVSNIHFFCIFMNYICNLMALQIIAKLVQKLCMIFEIFCHTNWTQNQYKSFANIFKIFSYFTR